MSKLRPIAVLLPLLVLTQCERKSPGPGSSAQPTALGASHEWILDRAGRIPPGQSAATLQRLARLAGDSSPEVPKGGIVIDSPLDGTVFPLDFTRPTFLWHDDHATADQWLIFIKFGDSEEDALTILVPGEAPPQPEIDLEAVADTNRLHEGPEYQNAAKAWTPGTQIWEEIKRRSLDRAARLTIMGVNSAEPTSVVSSGTVVLKTSPDPVGAPIFYRDVPLMPAAGELGKIRPLGVKAVPIIAWRLRDVSKPESKLVLKGMHSCANCHSFSSDGKTLGMDMDGLDGDKGMYTLKPLEKNMVIGKEDVITWNSFPDKPEGHRTLGLLSQVSPDGRFVASTLNEDIFIANFSDFKILQVFYPTRGIIGIYSRNEKHFASLPGADSPDYVQCNPVWSPDGRWIYFSRAKAFDAYRPGRKMPEYPNDPNEPQIRFDIWRVPFNGGKGGTPEPIAGASDNGFSNAFPRISPDNQWLVWTRCKNGMLLRPDGKLFMVPAAGGKPREMTCNTPLMNSWHSFSPNGRWMVFSSKARTPYTQAFLTHIDENGNDSPALLIPNCTAANRAVNLPEFLNAGYDDLDTIAAPVVAHHVHILAAERSLQAGDFAAAIHSLGQALNAEPTLVRALINMGVALGKLGKPEEGLLCTEKATSICPQDPYALFNSVALYLDANRPGMAATTLDLLVASAPYFPRLDDARKLVDQTLANLQNEITKTESALAREPDNVDGNHYLSELYRRAGRLEDSLKYLQKACDLSGGNPVLQCNLAWLLATNPDDAIRDGKRALELASKAIETTRGKRPEAWDVLAASYAELGQSAKAVEAHQRATQLARTVNPGLIDTWTRRARWFPQGKPLRMPRDR